MLDYEDKYKHFINNLSELHAIVIPAKAGIYCAAGIYFIDLLSYSCGAMDSRLRGNDSCELCF
jgi:hypothetical protein